MKTLFLAIALLFVSVSAQAADESDFYVKATSHSISYTNLGANSDVSWMQNETLAATATGFALGYQFSEKWSVEIEDIAETKTTVSDGSGGGIDLTYHISLITFTYAYKLFEQFNLLGSVGAYTNNVGFEYGALSSDDTNSSLAFGVGAQYQIIGMLSVQAGYVKYESSVSSIDMGVTFSF